MQHTHHLPQLLSTIFRLLSYVFLKIIPTRIATPALPFLYISHLISLALCKLPTIPLPDEKHTHVERERDRTPSLLEALIFSRKTRNNIPNALNLAINTLLFLASLDLALNPVFYPANDVAFARVGAVYPDAAKITVRYPSAAETQLRLLYREVGSTTNGWKDGPEFFVQQADDWVRTIKLDNLWPETEYEYAFADLNRTALSSPQRFETFPDPRLHAGAHFKFLASSCITPNFPYKGPTERFTIRGFDLLADYLKSDVRVAVTDTETAPDPVVEENPGDAPEEEVLVAEPHHVTPLSSLYKFMLFLGDFVYADVPIYFGDNPDAYLRLYRRNYASPSFKKILRQLPILFAYDDHEFTNNYGGEGLDLPPYRNASRAYSLYAGDSNYGSNDQYYNFTYADTAFFVLDTRRDRSNIETTPFAQRTMLGPAQLDAFHTWLAQVNQTATFKFVVSSVPFTSLWTHDAQTDSWAGFAHEKASVLEAMHSVPNVVVLSGDRHEFAAIEFATPTGESGHVVREFSTSPLNMFYIPFVRTLRSESEEKYERRRNVTTLGEDGPVTEVVTSYVAAEKVVKYIPDGNSKWASIEVDTRNQSRPVLRMEAVIDGKPAYHFETIGTPVNVRPSKAMILAPFGIKHLLGKLGFRPGRWF